jgi:hypothetical protein
MTMLHWNCRQLSADGASRTVEFRGKWIAYRDANRWLPIDPSFVATPDGGYVHTTSPWAIECPPAATGRIRLYNNQNYNPHRRDAFSVPTTPALELDHPDARAVSPVLDPARPWQVVYPDALGDGIDKLAGVWHRRYPSPENLIRIRTMPNGGVDARITERIYTPLRIPGWNGAAVDIGGSGAALLPVGDGDTGIRMRPAVAWYYDQAGQLVTTPIRVVVERQGGYVLLTKIIPRWFIADALAAGAYVLADETTSTFYPNANVETTSVDGVIRNLADESTWASIHDATAGTQVSDSGSTGNAAMIISGPASNTWDQFIRAAFLFDTSALTSAATVTSATLAIYGTTTTGTNGLPYANPTAGIVSSSPASNTALALGDYDQFGTTDFATRLTTWSTSAYNTFTLNAFGLAAISLTGITKTGLRVGPDIDNSPPTWQADYDMTRAARFAEESGTTRDPKLTVTYALPASPGSLCLLGAGI